MGPLCLTIAEVKAVVAAAVVVHSQPTYTHCGAQLLSVMQWQQYLRPSPSPRNQWWTLGTPLGCLGMVVTETLEGLFFSPVRWRNPYCSTPHRSFCPFWAARKITKSSLRTPTATRSRSSSNAPIKSTNQGSQTLRNWLVIWCYVRCKELDYFAVLVFSLFAMIHQLYLNLDSYLVAYNFETYTRPLMC